MKTLLAHPGTQHAFRLARELHRLNLLGEFWTSLALAENSPMVRLAGSAAHRVRNRIIPEVPSKLLHSRPWPELRSLQRLRKKHDVLDVLHQRNAAFQCAIPDQAICRNNTVIAFDTSGWLLAGRCRDLDKRFVLDRTIGHPLTLQRHLTRLHQDYPDWPIDTTPRQTAVSEAEEAEHTLAHRIVVGSSFARDSLIESGVSSEKLRVNPYGVDWVGFDQPPRLPDPASAGRPLRFLFAGSVLARKGVPVLMEAWRALAPKNAELWIAGGIEQDIRALIPNLPGLRLLGRVPNSEMSRIYGETDVLVLPSLMEGFSLVLLEALAAGLRIIATPNTGAADFLTDSFAGELIECGSAEALLNALKHQLENQPNRSAIQAFAAPLKERYSWNAYGRRWEQILRDQT